MTSKQREMLRHATGGESKEPGYRNRYCTEVNDPDALALVKMGMFKGPMYTDGIVGNGYGLFFATEKAFDFLGYREKK